MQAIKTRFFGRKTILQDLVEGLLAPSQPLDYSLVGPKLVGKSRLLQHLASDEGPLRGPDPHGWRSEWFRRGNNIIVGHYDCQWPAAQTHLTEFINQQLRDQLKKDRNWGLDWSQIEQVTSPGQQIGQIVRQLDHKQIRLVLLLDNFDRVLRSESITPDMANELRPLTSELGLVVATEQPLHDLNRTLAASPLFNVMHQHFVGLLEPSAAGDWLNAYHQRLPMADQVKAELLQMTGGHPFLLARINDIFMEMQSISPIEGTLDHQHLPLLRLRLAEHGRRLFEMNWAILENTGSESTLSMVKALAQKPIPIGELPAEQVALLNWLINQAMATYNEEDYRLFSPLFEKFLLEKFGLEQLTGDSAVTEADIFKTLSPIEADLFRYFRANKHTVISVEQLLADVWNQPDATPRRVQEAIRRLRNSLNKQSPLVGEIKNERGVGYRYVPFDGSA